MGQQAKKLLEKLLRKPVPADYAWSDLVKLMASYGYELHKAAGGSRRKFIHPRTKAILSIHAPHPSPNVAKGALASVIDHLTKHGHIGE